MAFILAPYNNAMRLGQGFNTFTQQICIDDAVITDPERAENVLTNDGTTMRILVQSMGRPSAWSRQKEVVAAETEGGSSALEDTESDAGNEPSEAKSSGGSTKAIERGDSEAKSPSGAAEIEDNNEGESKEHADKATTSTPDAPTVDAQEGDKAHKDTTSEDGVVVESVEAPSKPSDTGDVDPPEPASKGEKMAVTVTDLASKVKVPNLSKRSDRKRAEPKRSASADRGSQRQQMPKDGNVDWKLFSSQASADVDWDQYKAENAEHRPKRSGKSALMDEERERLKEERKERQDREKERREDEKQRKKEEREFKNDVRKERWEEEKQLRTQARKKRQEDADWERNQEKARRQQQAANVEEAASTKLYTEEEKAAMQKKMDVSFEERFKGLMEGEKQYEFDESSTGGPSQIVTYTSRFIDKLSDITEDMHIAGSLSIKAGKIGGSGRGSFIDSDKFKSSDLNFYISVKVVNQTINFKDALKFNSVRSVTKDNFREVFGDGFISGFQEGGEFNALVSMKVLNKAKKSDIQAEAKVAFTTGAVDLKATANVNIAKTNIETNTETTVQVSWSGGGHIKPREQPWNIESLMQAAARFPDLVAKCPQRTYAIITKYESLRSFVDKQPAGYTKLQYENAQIYTNALMDSYMEYKNLYTRVGGDIFDVRSKSKKIIERTELSKGIDAKEDASTNNPSEAVGAVVPVLEKQAKAEVSAPVLDISKFSANIEGLALAKAAIRKQMALIVNEVDTIEKDPKLATDDDHHEPFQDPIAFQVRLPKIETVDKRKSAMPLSGKRIVAKAETEDEPAEGEEAAVPLIAETNYLTGDEQTSIDGIVAAHPQLGNQIQLTSPLGSGTEGTAFQNLEFVQPQWKLTAIRVEISDGCLAAFWLHYANGLIISRGKAKNGRILEMTNFQTGERIISASISVGNGPVKTAEPQVIALQFHTNRGRSFVGQASTCSFDADKGHTRDGVLYTDVKTRFFDAPLSDGNLKGFYGRDNNEAIWRLGLIWGEHGTDKSYDGFTDSAASNEAMDPITQAKVESAARQAEVGGLKSQLQEVRSEKESLTSQINGFNIQLSDLRTQKDSLITEVNEIKSRELKPLNNGAGGYQRDRVEILFVIYGGRLIWDQATGERMLYFALGQTSFVMNNDTMGGNNWPDVFKSGTIGYRYDGKGPIRTLNGRQDETVRFDAF